MSSALQPEKILRELADLWASMAKPEHGASTQSGVLRACAMTLVVAAADEADAQSIGETIGELMHEHPSRAIVLKPSSATSELNSRVFAQCWMPFGGRQQICCEEIEITAGPDRIVDVPGVILGLLAPDLPKVLWVRGEQWFQAPQFQHVFPLIDKLIIDSARFESVSRAISVVRQLQQSRQRVADLAWARLTGWRQIIAHAFEPKATASRVPLMKMARITYGDRARVMPACYLGAWLKRAFPSAAITIANEAGDADVLSAQLSGEDFEFEFRRGEGSTILVGLGSATNTAMLPPATDCIAMRDELSITGADAIFEDVYPIAELLASKLQ